MERQILHIVALLLKLKNLVKALPSTPQDIAIFKTLTNNYLLAAKNLIDQYPNVVATAKVIDLQIGNDLYEKSDNPDVVYKWTRSEVRLEDLKQLKQSLKASLQWEKPTDEELVEIGKGVHPYYSTDTVAIDTKIAKLDKILEV